MKLLFNILIGIVVLLIIADALIWLMAAASSHQLPDGTHSSFGWTLIVLVVILTLLIYCKRSKWLKAN